MCYSRNASLIGWAIANVIALYLYKRNRNYDRWNAAFIFTFTLMQLVDAGLWSSLEDNDTKTNQLLTEIALFAIFLQALVQCYMGYLYTGETILYGLTFVFIFILVGQLLRVVGSDSQDRKTEVGPNGHLMWLDDGQFHLLGNPIVLGLYVIGIFLPLAYMKDKKGWPLIGVAAGTAAYSILTSKGEEVGSMWCFWGIIYAVVAVLV